MIKPQAQITNNDRLWADFYRIGFYLVALALVAVLLMEATR